MARTKNRGTNNAISPFSKQTPMWRLGKYLRLSKDDFKRGNGKDKDKEVSDSIENQRKILNEFEQMNADEFEWSEEYKDDGLPEQTPTAMIFKGYCPTFVPGKSTV